jgi:hypothetical protein
MSTLVQVHTGLAIAVIYGTDVFGAGCAPLPRRWRHSH